MKWFFNLLRVFSLFGIVIFLYLPVIINHSQQTSAASSGSLLVYCFASPNIAYRNQKIFWSVVASGGNGKYVYDWTGSDELSGISAYIIKTYSTPGDKSAIVTVSSGNTSATVRCNALVLPGWPPLSVSCSPSESLALTDQRITWSAKVSGGNGKYDYLWEGDASGDLPVSTISYESAGTKTARVTITSGGLSSTAQCITDILTSWPPLSVSCFTIPSSALINQNVTWHADVSGGTGKYTYEWSGSDELSSTSSSVSGIYTTKGTKTANVRITDSAGNLTMAYCSNLSVGPWPRFSVSCSTSPSSVFTGQKVNWIAKTSGGNRTYKDTATPASAPPVDTSTPSGCTFNSDCPSIQSCNNGSCVDNPATIIASSYAWSGDVSGMTHSVSTSYTAEGTKNATIKATDSLGHSATNTCSLKVSLASLTAYCFPSTSLASLNQQIVWTAVASGGSGTYTYNWDGTDSLSGTSSSTSRSYSTTGLKSAIITVTDSKQDSISIRCGSGVSVDRPTLLVSCSALPKTGLIGQDIIWSARASGGTGSYVYQWNGGAQGSFVNTQDSYDTAGKKATTVTVTSGGISGTSPSCYTVISP